MPRTAWTGNAFYGTRTRCYGSRRRRVLFDRCAEFIKRALVPLVFTGNTLRNRLHAFESRGRIEICTLFTAVQFELAARTLALRIKAGLQHSAAVRTSSARDRTDHPRRSRTDLIMAWMTLGRTLFSFLGLVRFHIAPMPILPLQRNLLGGCLHHTLKRGSQHEKVCLRKIS